MDLQAVVSLRVASSGTGGDLLSPDTYGSLTDPRALGGADLLRNYVSDAESYVSGLWARKSS